MDLKKPLPPRILKSLLPPNRDYDYFKDCQLHPFRPNSNKFQMVNAWWLADAALLSYADDAFVHEKLALAGLEGKCFTGLTTQCFVAHNDQFVIAAFRGTEISSFFDIVTDIRILLVPSGQGGLVHVGFKEGLEELWEDRGTQRGLRNYLNEIRKKDGKERTVWFTGHSLGAALATLAADRYGNVQGLYTFGSPRVGDSGFEKDFRISAYRFINNDDIVTRIPLGILYRHVGAMKYLDSKGRISDNPSVWEMLTDSFKGKFGPMFNSTGRLKSGFHGELPESGFTDHAMLYYTIQIWNNYVSDL